MKHEEGVPIIVNSVHPGIVATVLTRHSSFLLVILNKIGRYIFKNVQQGAATTCYVALHPQVKGVSEQYFANCNITRPSSLATNAELATKLWGFSLSLANPEKNLRLFQNEKRNYIE